MNLLKFLYLYVAASQMILSLLFPKQRQPHLTGMDECLLFWPWCRRRYSSFHDFLACVEQGRVVSSHWPQEGEGRIDICLSVHNLYFLKNAPKNLVMFTCFYFQKVSWVHTYKVLKALIIICEVIGANIIQFIKGTISLSVFSKYPLQTTKIKKWPCFSVNLLH